MSDNSLLSRLDGIDARFAEVSTLITDPSVIADMRRYVKLTKEYKDLERLTKTTHRYRSLLSAIPLPNPVVEKRRVAETYDYASSGIDYNKGTDHLVSSSHYVKCTDEEFAKWCR